jgi:uncharacterized protein
MTFIQRKLYSQLKKHLSKPEISLILGPRQAGKTTLMKKLAEELNLKGKKTAWFNLDVIEDKQFFKTQHTLLKQIKQTVGEKKGVVFIDEITRIKNAGLFLKGLYDLKTNYKFIVSGSGSLELKTNVVEPLTGRKRIFHCLPLSFDEFAGFKLKTSFAKLKNELKQNPFQTQRLSSEYFTYGGYPRIALAQTHQEKLDLLTEIYTSYLEKDIRLLIKVEKETAFNNLVKMLASQVGSLVNYSELANSLGINQKTIKKYLYFLEKTFVIKLIKPFYTNVRKELTKSPKIYFVDLGMLSLAQGIVPQKQNQIKGSVFENACLLKLLRLNLLKEPLFWRTQTGAEVDFIIFSPKTGKPIPIEAKLSAAGISKSFHSFFKKYRPKTAFFYTSKTKKQVKKQSTKIVYLPFYENIDLKKL